MTPEQFTAITTCRAAQRLNVRLDTGQLLSFASEASRDEFIERARRQGRQVEIADQR